MTIPVPASLSRLLLWGILLAAPGAMAQTTTAPKPQTTPPAKPATSPTKPKPTPVVQPHGATHAQKPPSKPAATVRPAPPPPAPPPAPPEAAKPPEAEVGKGSATGLPLPRFVSLRSDEVNLRAGPGTRYPIEWVYKRRDLPVEIEREFEVWRLVQDPDGIKGWVHQATLAGRRTFIVTGADTTLRRQAEDTAAAVAILKPGVIGQIRSCAAASDWCQVQMGDFRGYLKRSQFWGALPGEAIGG